MYLFKFVIIVLNVVQVFIGISGTYDTSISKFDQRLDQGSDLIGLDLQYST